MAHIAVSTLLRSVHTHTIDHPTCVHIHTHACSHTHTNKRAQTLNKPPNMRAHTHTNACTHTHTQTTLHTHKIDHPTCVHTHHCSTATISTEAPYPPPSFQYTHNQWKRGEGRAESMCHSMARKHTRGMARKHTDLQAAIARYTSFHPLHFISSFNFSIFL